MTVSIDKGIPLPGYGDNANRKYPWTEMEVGESFLLVGSQLGAHSLVRAASQRHAPRKFVARKTAEGYRVWRTA